MIKKLIICYKLEEGKMLVFAASKIRPKCAEKKRDDKDEDKGIYAKEVKRFLICI